MLLLYISCTVASCVVFVGFLALFDTFAVWMCGALATLFAQEAKSALWVSAVLAILTLLCVALALSRLDRQRV